MQPSRAPALTARIPKKIHRVWIGGPIPQEFEEYESEWKALHPDWEVKTWREDELVWIKNRAAFDDAPFLSSKSNIARYEIINRYGGIYVDCDFEPLRNFEEVIGDSDLVVGLERPGVFANGFFAAIPQHPTLVYAIDNLSISHFAQPTASSPQRTGPLYWTRCVNQLGIQMPGTKVLERELLYPYSPHQMHLRGRDFPNSWAIHHWAKSWVEPNTPRGKLPLRGAAKKAARRLKKFSRRAKEIWDRVDPSPPSRQTFPTFLGDNRVIVETVWGHPLISFADDLCSTPSLILRGYHDEAIGNFIRRELNFGDVVVDVGANIGEIAVHAAWRVGNGGRVIALEPNPRVSALLRDNFYMNSNQGLDADVEILAIAAGSNHGQAVLSCPIHHSGRGSLSNRAIDIESESIPVEVVPLDDLLKSIPEINYLKIDVEGYEADVLAGLKKTIQDRRVRLLDLELDYRLAGDRWLKLVDELESLAAQATSTFTLAGDGTRIPMAIGEAINQSQLAHWMLAFR